MNRSQAISLTHVAQGALAVGAVALGAVAFVGLPTEPPQAPPEEVVLPPVEQTTAAAEPAAAPLNGAEREGLARRMGRISNAPRKPEAVAAEPTPPETAPAPVELVTYHGMLDSPRRRLALIKDNGTQRFVAMSDKVGDLMVEVIEADHIRLGPSKVIPLADRNGGAVSLGVADSTGDVAARRRFDDAARPSPLASMGAAGRPQKAVNRKGGASIPAGLSPEDLPLWRKTRAQMLASGEYKAGPDLNEMAMKMMEERREELRGGALELTPDEAARELEFERQFPQDEAGGKEPQ